MTRRRLLALFIALCALTIGVAPALVSKPPESATAAPSPEKVPHQDQIDAALARGCFVDVVPLTKEQGGGGLLVILCPEPDPDSDRTADGPV